MAPTDSMDVELPVNTLKKIKADDDPESEGAFMRLSLLRFRMTRCVQADGMSLVHTRMAPAQGGAAGTVHAWHFADNNRAA